MPTRPRDGRSPVEPTPAEVRLEELFTRPRQARIKDGWPRLDVQDPAPDRTWRLDADKLVRRIVDAVAGVNPLVFWRRNATPPVIQLEDYFVNGTIDLRAFDFPYLLEFVHCRFEQPIDVRQARLAGLQFTGCWLPGLLARNLRSDSDVVLVDCTVDGEPVDITDAHIDGSLELTGSRLRNPGGSALRADRLTLAGALLGSTLEVEGSIRVSGAKIGGNLDLSGAVLHNPVGFTVDGNGIQIGGNLKLTADAVSGRPFTATGTLYVADAKISSEFSMRGAQLRPGERANPPITSGLAQPETEKRDNPYWDPNASLVADRAEVNGDVEFDEGFTSTGTLRMVNARIGGSLRMTSAEIDVSDTAAPGQPLERALHFDGTDVRGGLNMQRMAVTGQLRMMDLSVKGNARLDVAKLANPDADVLLAQRLQVGGNLVLRELQASGALLLQGATVGSNLDLRGARLVRPASYNSSPTNTRSLDLRAAKIGRDLVCAAGDRPFSAHGGVRMRRAEIGREANFAGAVLGSRLDGLALNGFGMQAQDLVLTVAEPPKGGVTLRHARCASLADNEKFWTATGRIDIEDFRYDALTTRVAIKDDDKVLERLRWLRKALRPRYQPGPYDQLAAVFRASGNEEHAATVLMEKQHLRYSALAEGTRMLGPLVLAWSWLQRSMVGYGYRPMRALAWLLVALVIGTAWFSLPGHRLVETDEQTHLLWNPLLYTIDLLVPIVDFGNKGHWRPDFRSPDVWASQWLSSALIAMGWLLATTVAAGLTRMLKRT